MRKDRIKGQNEDSTDEIRASSEKILTDWSVDREGNVFNVNEKFQTDNAELKGEFLESN